MHIGENGVHGLTVLNPVGQEGTTSARGPVTLHRHCLVGNPVKELMVTGMNVM